MRSSSCARPSKTLSPYKRHKESSFPHVQIYEVVKPHKDTREANKNDNLRKIIAYYSQLQETNVDSQNGNDGQNKIENQATNSKWIDRLSDADRLQLKKLMVDDIQKRKKKLRKLIGLVSQKKNKIDSIEEDINQDQVVLQSLKNKFQSEGFNNKSTERSIRVIAPSLRSQIAIGEQSQQNTSKSNKRSKDKQNSQFQSFWRDKDQDNQLNIANKHKNEPPALISNSQERKNVNFLNQFNRQGDKLDAKVRKIRLKKQTVLPNRHVQNLEPFVYTYTHGNICCQNQQNAGGCFHRSSSRTRNNTSLKFNQNTHIQNEQSSTYTYNGFRSSRNPAIINKIKEHHSNYYLPTLGDNGSAILSNAKSSTQFTNAKNSEGNQTLRGNRSSIIQRPNLNVSTIINQFNEYPHYHQSATTTANPGQRRQKLQSQESNSQPYVSSISQQRCRSVNGMYGRNRVTQIQNTTYHLNNIHKTCGQLNSNSALQSPSAKNSNFGQIAVSKIQIRENSRNSSKGSINSSRQNTGRFIQTLPGGKLVTGQKALTVQEYLESRNYRGLKSQGSGEIITYHAPSLKQSPKHHQDIKEVPENEEEDIAAIDWTKSKLFQSIENGGNIQSIEAEMLSMLSDDSSINDDDDDIFGGQKEQKKILSQVECSYLSQLIKQKISQKDFIIEDFTETIHKALLSLKALMKLLLLKKEWRKIKQRFIQEKMGSTGQQCLKLLLRVKKMYEAKSLMVRIIRMVIKRESINSNLEELSSDQREQISNMTSRILSLIDILKEENHIFKRPFIIKGMDYVQRLKDEYNQLQKQFYEHYQVEFESVVSLEGGN